MSIRTKEGYAIPANFQGLLGYVYMILNVANGKMYIGSSLNPASRFMAHLSALKKHDHHNPGLQEDFNTCGKDKFVFKIIGTYQPEKLFIMEWHWIVHYKTHESQHGYNLCAAGGVGTVSESTRKAISVRNTNPSPETRKKMSEAKRGISLSEETKNKIGDKSRLYRHSEDSKSKIGSHHKGKIVSEETRMKISESRRKNKLKVVNGGAA